MLDLSACGLWSRDGALISSWLVHCKLHTHELNLNDNPEFIGEIISTSSDGTPDASVVDRSDVSASGRKLSLKQAVRQQQDQRAASAKDDEGVSSFKEFG
eukprot:COSAG01_NODE_9408_length_2454_cov_1.415287_1_plen_99_part_10